MSRLLQVGLWLAIGLIVAECRAQALERGLSPASQALGGTGLAWSGMDGLARNPAAAASPTGLALGLMAEDRFALGAIRQLGLSMLLPSENGGWGLAINRYGNTDYREHALQLTHGRRLFESFSLGLSLGLWQSRLTDHGQRTLPLAAVGFRWQGSPRLVLAGSLRNPFRAFRSAWDRVPTLLGMGLLYRPFADLHLLADLIKELDQPLDLRLGLAYQPIPALTVRLGLRPNTPMVSTGLGIRWKSDWRLDLAVQSAPYLPLSPSLGLVWCSGSAGESLP